MCCPAAQKKKPRNSWPTKPSGICPVANLKNGFEEYLKQLSSNRRQQIRRLIREGDKLGVELQLATTETLDEFYEQLITLHQERWIADGKPGVFASEPFTRFHRRLLETGLPGLGTQGGIAMRRFGRMVWDHGKPGW